MKVTDDQFYAASEIIDAIMDAAVQAKIDADEGHVDQARQRLRSIVDHAQFGQLMLEGWAK